METKDHSPGSVDEGISDSSRLIFVTVFGTVLMAYGAASGYYESAGAYADAAAAAKIGLTICVYPPLYPVLVFLSALCLVAFAALSLAVHLLCRLWCKLSLHSCRPTHAA
jgi:hypothetical protein